MTVEFTLIDGQKQHTSLWKNAYAFKLDMWGHMDNWIEVESSKKGDCYLNPYMIVGVNDE